MKPVNYSFASEDGLSLFARAWVSPLSNPKGIVYLVHGLGEHSGRYDHVGKALAEAGYHLAGFDLRGHGLSEGPRGHAPGLPHLLDDIHLFINETSKHLGNHRPNFIYGHGLGGNLAVHFSLENQITLHGAIVTCPAFKLTTPKSTAKITFAKIMANLMPWLTLKNGLETQALSRNDAIVKAYQKDVYVHNKVSARLGLDLLESGQMALENAHQWALPLLLMHGTEDRITSCSASEKFAAKASRTVDLVLWEGYYHELHNDFGSEEVIQTMIGWLDQNLN